MFYCYTIQDKDKNLYYGSTNNLKQRIFEHNNGEVTSTKGRRWRLIYYEAYASEEDARNREKQIKYNGQAKRWLKERIKDSLKQS